MKLILPTNKINQPLFSSWMFLMIVLAIWAVLSLNFIFTLPDLNFFTHDMGGHVQYTQLIHQLKKLPRPDAGWQTYQPPLYYSINQLFSPSSANHIVKVRLFSIVYGAVFLICCHIVMNLWSIPQLIQLLSLFYFMSIPAFIHLFTTYNNDSLAMAVSAAIIAATAEYYFSRKRYLVVVLFVLAAAGVYTKYNIILLISSIGILLCGACAMKAIPLGRVVLILLPLTMGCLTIAPYLRLHNFQQTGRYLVHNAEGTDMWPFWHIDKQVGFGTFFFKPPAITNGEWEDPYALDKNYEIFTPNISFWTKCTYISSIISTSLFGEFNYSKKAPAADTGAWISLWIHILLLASISYLRKSVRLMSWLLLLTLFIHGLFIRFSHPFFIDANFRFFAWITLPLVTLTATEFHACYQKNSKKYFLLLILLIGGILAHIIYFNVLNYELAAVFKK